MKEELTDLKEELINLENLRTLSRHNHSFIREILEVFLINTPKDLEHLWEKYEVQDWQMVRYYSHKLKSSSHTIGFDAGHRIFNNIERVIKNNEDHSVIGSQLREASESLSEALVRVKIELANLV